MQGTGQTCLLVCPEADFCVNLEVQREMGGDGGGRRSMLTSCRAAEMEEVCGEMELVWRSPRLDKK